MPLMNCPACRKEVSSVAECCPHCGHPIAKEQQKRVNRKYKKTGRIFMFLGMVCIMGGCIGHKRVVPATLDQMVMILDHGHADSIDICRSDAYVFIQPSMISNYADADSSLAEMPHRGPQIKVRLTSKQRQTLTDACQSIIPVSTKETEYGLAYQIKSVVGIWTIIGLIIVAIGTAIRLK